MTLVNSLTNSAQSAIIANERKQCEPEPKELVLRDRELIHLFYRLMQLETGIFQIVMIDKKPRILVRPGKHEIL